MMSISMDGTPCVKLKVLLRLPVPHDTGTERILEGFNSFVAARMLAISRRVSWTTLCNSSDVQDLVGRALPRTWLWLVVAYVIYVRGTLQHRPNFHRIYYCCCLMLYFGKDCTLFTECAEDLEV